MTDEINLIEGYKQTPKAAHTPCQKIAEEKSQLQIQKKQQPSCGVWAEFAHEQPAQNNATRTMRRDHSRLHILQPYMCYNYPHPSLILAVILNASFTLYFANLNRTCNKTFLPY